MDAEAPAGPAPPPGVDAPGSESALRHYDRHKQLLQLDVESAELKVKAAQAALAGSSGPSGDAQEQFKSKLALHQAEIELKRALTRLALRAENQPESKSEVEVPNHLEAPKETAHATLQGTVTDVKNQVLAEISLGADDGLRKGDTLNVFRDKTYLGKFTVVNVLADKSAARIESRKGVIQPGDAVATETPPEASTSPVDR